MSQELPILQDLDAEIIRLSKLVEQREELDALRQRLAALAPPADQGSKWPDLGVSLNGVVAGLATLVLPLSTLIYGYSSQERDRITAEHNLQREAMIAQHDIVAHHLDSALSRDHSDSKLLRHLRFLKTFQPHPNATFTLPVLATARPEILTGLGTWANTEYEQYFAYLNAEVPALASSINDLHRKIALAKARLEIDRGWIESEKNTWTTEGFTLEQFGAGLDLAYSILENRRAEIEEYQAELDEKEARWLDISIAFQMDGHKELGQTVYDDPIDFLERRCTVDKLACIEHGELLYARALAARSQGDANSKLSFEAANHSFEEACNARVHYGCSLLARSYQLRQGLDGIGENDASQARAVELFQQACGAGDPQGCNGLGWHEWVGDGIAVDATGAGNHFRRSCDLGWLNGCDSWGTWLARQQKDKETARQVFQNACNLNEIRACINLVNLDLERNVNDFASPTIKKHKSK